MICCFFLFNCLFSICVYLRFLIFVLWEFQTAVSDDNDLALAIFPLLPTSIVPIYELPQIL